MKREHRTTWRLYRLVCAILFVFLIGWVFCSQVEKVRAQNVADAVPAVVRINGCDTDGCDLGWGSGVIIHPSGLILTARHVTKGNKDDPNSDFFKDFIIEMTENFGDTPTARYRAKLVASSNAEIDLALLWLYWDEGRGSSILPGTLTSLPFLAIGDSERMPIGEKLFIWGYPEAGGENITYSSVEFGGFTDNTHATLKGAILLGKGSSGGPVLVEQANNYQIIGVVTQRRGDAGEVGIIRSIKELRNLDWTPGTVQVWNGPTQIESDGDQLQIRTTLNAIDFDQRPVRLLAYAFDAANPSRPWPNTNSKLASRSGQLVIPHELTIDGGLVINEPVQFSFPLADIDVALNQLVFRTVLWDPARRSVLWSENSPVAVRDVANIVQVSTPAITSQLPDGTRSITESLPTQTWTPTASSTPTEPITAVATPTSAPTATTIPPTHTPIMPTSATLTPTSEAISLARVTSLRLNLRAGPDTSYTILDTLGHDTELIVKGQASDSNWLAVQTIDGTQEGWVSKPLTDFVGSAPVIPEGDIPPSPTPTFTRLTTPTPDITIPANTPTVTATATILATPTPTQVKATLPSTKPESTLPSTKPESTLPSTKPESTLPP